MSLDEFQFNNQLQQSFERNLKSPLTTYVQNPQLYEEIILRNQQSASPKCQQPFTNDKIFVEDQLGTRYTSNSIDNDLNLDNKYYFQQLPMNYNMQYTGESFLSERHQTEEDQIISENGQTSLYLENGRYKNSFIELNFLGKGGFGICYKVQHKLDLNFYAIKKIRMHLAQNQDIKEHKVYREIMALPMLNHKNVVRYFGCWAEKIDSKQENQISKRVKQIQKIIQEQRKKGRKIKEQKSKKLNHNKQLDRLKSKQSTDEYFNINDFDVEKDLDDAFQQNKSNCSIPSSPHKSRENDAQSEKDEDNEDEYSYINDDESYEVDQSQDEEENESHISERDEKEDDNEEELESSFYSENEIGSCQNYDEERDDKVSDFDEETNSKGNSARNQDDSQGQVGMFDDDALFEFIKKDQQFVSIDLMIQMEYCSGDTLHDKLQESGRKLDRHLNFQYFKQIMNAVKHIHKNGFIHRDLKPANIFLEGTLLKVGDFGLARKFNMHLQKLEIIEQALNSASLKSPKRFKNIGNKGLKQLVRSISQQSLLTSNVGTSTYLSPEQESNKPYNEKVDIYALGLILCELCCVFSTEHERIQTLNDLKRHGKIPASLKKNYPQEAEIMLMMVNKNPELRPSADSLSKHYLMTSWAKSLDQRISHELCQSKSLQQKDSREALQEIDMPNQNTQNNPSLNMITEEQTDKSQCMTSKYNDSLNNSFKMDSINRLVNLNSKQKLIKVSSVQDYNKFVNLNEQTEEENYFGFNLDRQQI